MLFFILLIAATPILITANEQNSYDALEIDNSPMAYKQFNGQESELPFCICNEDFDKCMKSCPTIALYDPVCGTDGVTYVNLAELACAQCCGKGVTVKHHGPCQESLTE